MDVVHGYSYFLCVWLLCCGCFDFFFFKQKTAYEMRISDWSSDVCSSDLALDPSHLATLFCGAEQAGSTLARELLIASAFAAPASEAGPIPLLDRKSVA